jgi:iron complex outermembrane receptor protein
MTKTIKEGIIMKATYLSSIGVVALLSWPAFAQNAPATAASDQTTTANTGLQDIVVTAQRRSERLQDVPVAVTAVTASKLQAAGIVSSQDLAIVTPGLSEPQTAGFSQPRVRGIGTASNGPGVENPVATYIDGVYLASAPSSLLSLNNIDRVEVLKGPQGTLFGRNATGGLIQIITKDPGQTTHASADLTYGNYRDVVADAYVTGGLTDNLAADVAVRYEHQDKGYGHNLFDGSDVGKIDHDFAGRAKFLYEPSSVTKVRLSLDYEDRVDDQYIQHLDPQYPATFNNAAFGGPFPLGGPYDVDIDDPFKNRLKAGGISLQIDQDFDAFTLKSITAYRRTSFSFNLDLDYLPINGTTSNSGTKFEQFSQELQLASRSGGRFTWVAGFYYFHANDQWSPLEAAFGPILSPIPGVPLVRDDYSRQITNSVAGYAQGTYEFAPKTRITLGGRFTYEEKSGSGAQTTYVNGAPVQVTPFPQPGLGIPNTINFKRFNYRITLDHRFTPNVMAYVTYDTGFKSGGYVLASPGAQPYKPEDIKAVEGGVKSQLFDRHVRLNVAGFYYDYRNIQIQRYDVGSLIIYNGAKARLYGLDLDGEILIAHGLSLNGGFSYIHDRFTSFPNADFIIPVDGCVPAPGGTCSGSANGKRLPFTPTTTADIGGTYTLETGIGKFAFNATYYRSGKLFAAPDNVLFQKSYDLVNASIAWTDTSKHLTVSLWGKNLGKTVYANSLLEGFSGGVRSLGAPRTYGVTAGFNF